MAAAGLVKKESLKKSTLPRNVNLYSHFFAHPYITELDINWVLKLRKQDSEPKLNKSHSRAEPPSTYGKNTASYQHSLSRNNQPRLRGPTSSIEHLIFKRVGIKPTINQVAFQSGLRSQPQESNRNRAREAQWRGEAYKDRREYPSFIVQHSLQSIKKKSFTRVSAQDGSISYPHYSDKIVRRRNMGQFAHIALSGDLPSLGFVSNLRHSQPVVKKRKSVISRSIKK